MAKKRAKKKAPKKKVAKKPGANETEGKAEMSVGSPASPTTSPKITPRITEGVLIAGIPFLGYVVAFLYEAGYATYFGIPIRLLNIGLTQVMVATGAVLGVLTLLWHLFNLGYLFFPGPLRRGPVSRGLLRVSVFAVPTVTMIWVYRGYWQGWIYFVAMVGFVGFFQFVFPLIIHRTVRGYRAKLEAQEKHEQQIVTLGDTLARKWGASPIIVVGCLAMILLVALSAGHARALRRITFLVHAADAKQVVLGIYGDTVVSAKYDSETRELSGELLIQKMSASEPFKLVQQRIGPLTPKKLGEKGDKKGTKH